MHIKPYNRRRGAILITAMWIIIALAAVVLVLCRSMTVEARVVAQRVDQAKADAAERGAEQLVLAALGTELLTPGTIDAMSAEALPIGECYAWLLKPTSDDTATDSFGLTDEGGKIDLNTATVDMLMLLPNMTEEFASSIVDWRDTDENVTGTDGAEESYYMSLDTPYHCKNAPFESVGELALVRGATDDLLYGADLNHNGILEADEAASANAGSAFSSSARGIMPFVSVYGTLANKLPPTAATVTAGTTTITAPVDINGTNTQNLQALLQTFVPGTAQQIMQATQQNAGTFTSIFDWAIRCNMTSQDLSPVFPYLSCTAPRAGGGGGRGGGGAAATTTATAAKININTAAMATLMCIPNLTEAEAQAIISYRDTTASADPSLKANVGWVMDLVAQTTLRTSGQYITGSSSVYSADIVTVSQDGRAFKRVRVVIDSSTGTPKVIYRRDLTSSGWPLDPAIRESLRSGNGPTGGDGDRASRNNGLSLGVH